MCIITFSTSSDTLILSLYQQTEICSIEMGGLLPRFHYIFNLVVFLEAHSATVVFYWTKEVEIDHC